MKDQGNKKNLNEPAYMAKAVKPQTVRNTLGLGGGRFTPGKCPPGFQGMWVFDGTNDYKNSPTSKPEPQRNIINDASNNAPKVKNRIVNRGK